MTARPGPLVSVVVAARDGEPHLESALASVRAQTLGDAELLVAGGDLNEAIRTARGRYVALLAAADLCNPERLARQVAFLEAHDAAGVFSWVELVDERGEALAGPHVALQTFNRPAVSRARTLRDLVFEEDRLCASTALVERELLLAAGGFAAIEAPLHEQGLWLRLLLRGDLPVVPEPLVRYRAPDGQARGSRERLGPRAQFVRRQLVADLLDRVPEALFLEAFAAELRDPGSRSGGELELEKGFVCLRHPSALVRGLGAERLYRAFRDPAALALAIERYGFGLPELELLLESGEAAAAAEYFNLRQWSGWLDDQNRRLTAGWVELRAEVERLRAELERLAPS